MEKLTELYYEYELDLLKREMRVNWATEREIEMADIEKVDEDELEENLNKLSDLKPFIKWLVENEKIDRKKLEKRPFSDGLIYSDSDCTVYRNDTTYEMLLMLLAIQDEPIEFLVSILK